jgi:hypothetical protein
MAMLRDHTWRVKASGYATARRFSDGSGTIQMHCFLMGEVGIDHRNGIKLDNRRDNLRRANQSQNNGNAKKFKKACTSRYKGVSRVNEGWTAKIQYEGRKKHLGTFSIEEEAAVAYDEAARRTFGEYACVNFPKDGERSCDRGDPSAI